jgi:hypothetical protein
MLGTFIILQAWFSTLTIIIIIIIIITHNVNA